MSKDPLVTLLFVGDEPPATVLRTEPNATPGFGRKYLAQLDPEWDIAHIGNFDLNRSAPPGPSEYYIGGYPQLAIVQAIMPGLEKFSELDPKYLTSIPATEIFGTLISDPGEISGFAQWNPDGTVRRSFSANSTTIFEDIGLPFAFEAQFWNVDVKTSDFTLPFDPRAMAQFALEYWLDTDVSPTGLAIPIAAFATDGRPSSVTDDTEYSSTDLVLADTGDTEDTSNDKYDDYTPDSLNTDESTIEAEVFLGRAKAWLSREKWAEVSQSAPELREQAQARLTQASHKLSDLAGPVRRRLSRKDVQDSSAEVENLPEIDESTYPEIESDLSTD